MKMVRILVYEGSEEDIKNHVAQVFVSPDKPHIKPRARVWLRPELLDELTIHEIFRGSMPDPVVEHMDAEALVATIEDATGVLSNRGTPT